MSPGSREAARGTRGRPRILFFLPTLLVGGAERHTVELCLRLRERGYPTRILVHHAAVSPIMRAHPAGADAIVLGLKGMSDPGGWVTIWRVLRRERPDLVVAVNQSPLIIAIIERWAFATAARLACIMHTTVLQSYEAYQEKLLVRLAPFTDLMVYVGANQKRVWEARGVRPRRAALIPNGVDTGRFASGAGRREERRAQLGVAPGETLLGILASFRPEKNHGELIAALAEARRGGASARLLCIGDGETRPAVQARAAALGIADAVLFAGEQTDVPSWLAACDVGVLCSTVETFPLSAIEFLASGVPMIGAAVGGVPEIVADDRNGFLYPPGEVGRLADAIAALCDPGRRAGLAGAARASVAAFSADRMVDRYEEEFDAVVRR